MVHQTRRTDAGAADMDYIEAVSANQLTLRAPLANNYLTDGGASRAQVLWVPQYRNVTINSGVRISPAPWNGTVGGILAFLASGTVTVLGTIFAGGDVAD